MSRRSMLSVLVFLTIVSLLAACGPTPEPQTIIETVEVEKTVVETVEVEVPAARPEGDTIRIGGVGPLSAPGSVVGGIGMQFAMNLAVQDINEAGGVLGKDLELIFADTEGLPERGGAAAERLITENGVVAITGEYHSAVGLVELEMCHEYGIPCLFSETWSDSITASGYPEVFRIAPASSMNSRATVEWFAAVGAENVVSIVENTDYGIGQNESDQQYFEELGINSQEVFFVELGTEDFLPILTRVQALDPVPDAIRVAVTGETSYNLEQQMAELGIAPSADTIGTANQVAIQPEFWESVPNGAYYVFSLVGLPPSLYNDTTQHVADAYSAQFDTDPPSYALEAYDSVWILADAMERAGTTESAALIDALEDTDITLAQGRYYFEYTSKNPLPDDGSVPDYMWHQWPDPAVLLLQYFEPNQDWKEAAVVWPEVYQTHGTAYIPFEEKAPAAVAPPVEGDTIRVGGVGPLSAPGTVVGGIAMQFAMNLAVQDVNEAGGVLGKPIELIFADTEGLPERGGAVVERLINENNVVAVTGEYHSAVGMVELEVCHEYGIPCLFSETWSDSITASGYAEVFRIAPASSMNSRAMADWYAAVGVENPVIIAENTDYGIGQAESDMAFMEEVGIPIDEDRVFYVELGTEDFLPILTRVQALDPVPDAIRVAVTGETSYNLEQQMAELGIAPSEETIGTANQVAIQPEFWESVPNGNYYVFSLVGLPPSLYNDTTVRVADAYSAQFESDPPSYALEAYDSIWILADAIERAGTTESAALIAALEETDITLAQGRYWFQYTSANPIPDDGSVPDYMWHQWPDPAVLLIQYFEPNQDWKDAAVVWPEVYQTHGTTYIVPGTTP
jgi:branched-chain amino acid transport system substrate-binding protein